MEIWRFWQPKGHRFEPVILHFDSISNRYCLNVERSRVYEKTLGRFVFCCGYLFLCQKAQKRSKPRKKDRERHSERVSGSKEFKNRQNIRAEFTWAERSFGGQLESDRSFIVSPLK